MFEPQIICFYCKWCTYSGADLAGTSRMKYVPNGVVIKTMCSSRVDPQYILQAFKRGAEGVLIGGCHHGDCHYSTGNQQTYKRVVMLKNLLASFGIDPQRLRLEWISASEGQKLVDVMNSFTEELREMGPVTDKKG